MPSAHLTLGRFVTTSDHETVGQRRRWVEAIEDVNAWLQREYWGEEGDGEDTGTVTATAPPSVTERKGLEWVVGSEKGLEVREGRLWYGGGTTVAVGRGCEDYV